MTGTSGSLSGIAAVSGWALPEPGGVHRPVGVRVAGGGGGGCVGGGVGGGGGGVEGGGRGGGVKRIPGVFQYFLCEV